MAKSSGYQETVSDRAAPLRCGSTGTVAASQGNHAVCSTTIFLSVIDHSLSSPAKRVLLPLAPPFPLGAEVLASQACPAKVLCDSGGVNYEPHDASRASLSGTCWEIESPGLRHAGNIVREAKNYDSRKARAKDSFAQKGIRGLRVPRAKNSREFIEVISRALC